MFDLPNERHYFVRLARSIIYTALLAFFIPAVHLIDQAYLHFIDLKNLEKTR